MTDTIFTNIRFIAKRVRKWAEDVVACDPEMFYHKDLCGLCAIASAELWRHLADDGIDAKIVVNDDGWQAHCFVMVDDFIVDVTATQFGKCKIVVEKYPKDAPNYWTTMIVFDNPEELVSWQEFEDWPTEQIARV